MHDLTFLKIDGFRFCILRDLHSAREQATDNKKLFIKITLGSTCLCLSLWETKNKNFGKTSFVTCLKTHVLWIKHILLFA